MKELARTSPARKRTLFAFSYACKELFRFAKDQGWTTVLGQIDPGPYEERIVQEEHERYPGTGSNWSPLPTAYWEAWREEVALADRILVNSEWARSGLMEEGVPEKKIDVIPLVYDPEDKPTWANTAQRKPSQNALAHQGDLQVLFLGSVCLRKGIARLIEAMRMLKDAPVRLTICGPLSVSPSLWADLPSVRWVHSVQNASIRTSYQAADVFILPTISDGFARTQLEALAAGTPVIASRYCGEVVIHGVNGYLLDQNTPVEIAGMLRQLANNRQLLARCKTDILPEGAPRTLDQLAARLLNSSNV